MFKYYNIKLFIIMFGIDFKKYLNKLDKLNYSDILNNINSEKSITFHYLRICRNNTLADKRFFAIFRQTCFNQFNNLPIGYFDKISGHNDRCIMFFDLYDVIHHSYKDKIDSSVQKICEDKIAQFQSIIYNSMISTSGYQPNIAIDNMLRHTDDNLYTMLLRNYLVICVVEFTGNNAFISPDSVFVNIKPLGFVTKMYYKEIIEEQFRMGQLVQF